jgi:hypothetical protein
MESTRNVESTPPQATSSSGLDPQTGMVESDFIILLRARLIGVGGTPTWPPSTMTPDQVIADMNAALQVLFLRREQGVIPAGGAPAGTAVAIVTSILTDTSWPNEPPNVPEPWHDGAFVAFRRYEIACAGNLMMMAFQLSFAGGGTAGWPPQKPTNN